VCLPDCSALRFSGENVQLTIAIPKTATTAIVNCFMRTSPLSQFRSDRAYTQASQISKTASVRDFVGLVLPFHKRGQRFFPQQLLHRNLATGDRQRDLAINKSVIEGDSCRV